MPWFSGAGQNERLLVVGDALRPAVVQGVNVGHVVGSGGGEGRVGNGVQSVQRGLKVKGRVNQMSASLERSRTTGAGDEKLLTGPQDTSCPAIKRQAQRQLEHPQRFDSARQNKAGGPASPLQIPMGTADAQPHIWTIGAID